MVDKNSLSSSISQDHQPAAPQDRSPRGYWTLLLVLLFAGGIFAMIKFLPAKNQQQANQPLDGKFLVIVRPSERGVEPIPIEKAGALPVRFNGIMSLEANFNQPACAYFVWFDCEGRILPLYPWNYDTLDVTDIHQPPPTRHGAKIIYSPPIGAGWQFGKKGGIETVMMLARREPLDANMSLGSLLSSLQPPKVRHPEELVGFGLNQGAESVSTLFSSNRTTDEDSRTADESVKSMMLRLREHFELIRVVRFAHEEQSPTDSKKTL